MKSFFSPFKQFLFGRKIPTQATNREKSKNSLSLFISSTFQDMKKERDIISRSILPRIRESLTQRNIDLQEFDLRWGITQTMAMDGGAALICIREIEVCSPLIFGMIGGRIGWRPPTRALEIYAPELMSLIPHDAGMTEIELQYAALLAKKGGDRKPPIFMRTERLSTSLGEKFENSENFLSMLSRIRKVGGEYIFEYDELRQFELEAEEQIKYLIEACLKKVAVPFEGRALPQCDRDREIFKIRKAARSGRPVLVAGEPTTGLTWLLRQSFQDAPNIKWIDGRSIESANPTASLSSVTDADDAGTSSEYLDDIDLNLKLSMENLGSDVQIIFDHFEESFQVENRVDLSMFPIKLVKGQSLVVASRNIRIRRQAESLRWTIIEIPRIDKVATRQFCRQYLAAFGKSLEEEQVSRILNAKWANRIGSLILALDELRRFGDYNTLDRRVDQLCACETDYDLAGEVLSGIRSYLPPPWSDALDDSLSALAVSLQGLREEEIRNAAGSAEQPLPAHIWSAIRINLRSALTRRGPTIDLGSGPVALWINSRHADDPALAKSAASRVCDALKTSPASRLAIEAPRLAYATGGEVGLTEFLRNVDNALASLDIGGVFTDAWLDRLDMSGRRQVFNSWREQVELRDGQDDAAWRLGRTAARFGDTEAALAFFSIDEMRNPIRPARNDLEALLTAEPRALLELAKRLASAPDAEMLEDPVWGAKAITIFAAAAKGDIEIDVHDQAMLINRVHDYGCHHDSLITIGQANLHYGQIEMNRARWRTAAKAFEEAEKAARRRGHARLLCKALERGSLVAIKLNAFRSARQKLLECLDLSRNAELHELEHLSFEGLIDIERRRSNWSDAYNLVEQYRLRCIDAIGGRERAQRALDSLEQ